VQVIDPTLRTEAALLLRRLASGRITNDDFDDRYPRRSLDPGVVAIGELAWTLYSDLRTYRLVGVNALSSEDRRLVARCVLFLHSGLEYSWPPFQKTPFPSSLRELFSVMRHVTAKAPDATIDFEIWPFASAADITRAAHVPNFLTAV
jgi:hypothetical protein